LLPPTIIEKQPEAILPTILVPPPPINEPKQ
jgi:hypothetical protein